MSNPAAKAAPRLWRGLRLPEDCAAVLAEPRYHNTPFCRLYLDGCERLLAERPAEALATARCAPQLVARLRPSATRDELQLRALALLGSAWRAAGDMSAAAAAFALAVEVEQRATGRAAGGGNGRRRRPGLAPAVLGDVYRRHAGLLIDQGHFGAAAELLDRAIGLVAPLPPGKGEHHLGALILERGVLQLRQRRFAAAIDDFGLALGQLDSKRNSRAYYAAAQGLALALALAPELALVNQATRWLRAARLQQKGQRGSLARFRLYCIEAAVLAQVGSTRRAQKNLQIARKGFARGKAWPELVLAALQLADLLHGEGRFAELAALAGETLAACRPGLEPALLAPAERWQAAAADLAEASPKAAPAAAAALAAAGRELRAGLAATLPPGAFGGPAM